MTVIEKQYMESVINISRMMRKTQDAGIDWEHRRYEIAKEAATYAFSGALSQPIKNRVTFEELAEAAVLTADAVIAKLQEEK